MVFTLCLPGLSWAQDLEMWIMPNELPPVNEPSANAISDTAIEDFMDSYSTLLLHNENELKEDYDFAACVLRQRKILEIVREYIDEHNVNVRIRIIPWIDAIEEISSLSEDGPDIVQLGTTWTAYFANKGILAKLTEEITPGDYYESSIASCKINNSEEIYAVPWFVDVRALYCWRNILEDAGVNLNEDLKDRQAFKDACRKIKDWTQNNSDTTTKAFGIPIKRNYDLLHEFAVWTWAGGGDILKKGKAAFHEKETLDSIESLIDLRKRNYLELPKIDLGEIEMEFVKRKYAMIIGRVGVIERLLEKSPFSSEDIIGVPLPPSKGGKGVAFVGGSNLAILESSRNRGTFEEALELVKLLAGITNSRALFSYTRAIGMPPALKRDQSAIESHFDNNDTLVARFKRAMECGRSYPNIPEWIVVEEKVPTYFYLIWQDIAKEKSATEIQARLKRIAKEVNLDLSLWWLKEMCSSSKWWTRSGAKYWGWIIEQAIHPGYRGFILIGDIISRILAIIAFCELVRRIYRLKERG